MRKIDLIKGNLTLKDKIEGFLEKEITTFGNSAKADCPKRFIGRRAYILICKNGIKKRVDKSNRKNKNS